MGSSSRKARGVRRLRCAIWHSKNAERPISAQLFGSDPEVLSEAASICQDMGFDIVDINFGCPVNKVVKCNGGSGLLRDLPLVETILTSVRKAITIPLTCKFRAGWNDKELVFVQMAQLAENCGLAGGSPAPAELANRDIAERRTGLESPGRRRRSRFR